jgi:glycosyltransferase involved in cell wall biosynthesis
MRLAYFSPLHPAPSGISDYSKELLPHLAAHADITLVVDGYTPSDPELKSFRILDDKNYDAREFDVALYQLGNSPAHAYIYERARREPGVIVLHDLVLHHLVAWLTIQRGDAAGYVAAMRDAYGEDGARLAQREVLGLDALNRFDYPLSECVVRHARGVIAHSRYVADAVKRMAPNVPVVQIPHEMPDLPLLAQDAARAQLRLPNDARLIGTFGNLGPTKRATVLFDAFRAVRERFPDARLLVVGASSPNFDVAGLTDLFGLRDAVQMIGHVPFDAFHAYMAAVDVGVNLRYPTAGETSGAVLRLMAQAKAVVVSRVGWFAELPDDAVAKIDVDDHEVAQLTITLARLLEDVALRAAMGENARRYVTTHCAVQDAARYYAEFLQAVWEGRAVSRVFGIEKAESEKRETRSEKRETRDEKREARDEKREARDEKRDSELRIPNSEFSSDWREELARAYVELGLNAEDAVLKNIAQAVADLGLSEE